MGFANVPQWKRHKVMVKVSVDQQVSMGCERCGLTFPASLTPGQIVLSKEDRLFIGDDVRATDCP